LGQDKSLKIVMSNRQRLAEFASIQLGGASSWVAEAGLNEVKCHSLAHTITVVSTR
jgi:hypothetical protein